ncbi:hypothetical protein SK128_023016, partial [Halocaridina rubra]
MLPQPLYQLQTIFKSCLTTPSRPACHQAPNLPTKAASKSNAPNIPSASSNSRSHHVLVFTSSPHSNIQTQHQPATRLGQSPKPAPRGLHSHSSPQH